MPVSSVWVQYFSSRHEAFRSRLKLYVSLQSGQCGGHHGDYPPADAVHLHNWVIRNAVVVYWQEVHTAVL